MSNGTGGEGEGGSLDWLYKLNEIWNKLWSGANTFNQNAKNWSPKSPSFLPTGQDIARTLIKKGGELQEAGKLKNFPVVTKDGSMFASGMAPIAPAKALTPEELANWDMYIKAHPEQEKYFTQAKKTGKQK